MGSKSLFNPSQTCVTNGWRKFKIWNEISQLKMMCTIIIKKAASNIKRKGP
jgi:CRISPR/Cas system CMR-associated protein Cmr1 (group 7 of RAMP superfamily)